jgi:glycine/D-amino acid oxidase-like deaminating enzyme
LKASKVDNEDEMRKDEEFYRQHLGADVEVWSTAQVRDMLRSKHYFNALHFPRAFHIHPLNYALGLADRAEAAGVRIFEDTPARAIDPAGVRKRVTTPAGRVRASQIVLACNVHLGSLLPRITGTLVPIWSYVIVTKPLGSQIGEALTYRGAVTDTNLANNHYRIVAGDRLLWGGRSRTWDAEARGFAPSLVADIAQVYPQLGQVEADYVWSGVLGNALHQRASPHASDR